MITPSDKEYRETKQIMLQKKSMKSVFRKLADWIDEQYLVKTINIIYDTFDKGQRPRLQVCFEFEKEKLKFLDNSGLNFDNNKQAAIANKFRETLLENAIIQDGGILDFLRKPATPEYMTKNIWVIFGSFEPIARIEANENIPESKVQKLQQSLDSDDLWKISRAFAGTTFFLFTDDQVKRYENNSIKQDWTNKYFALLEQYNEFGYFKRDSFSIYLDSKENFDKNYESNWYYYYK